MVATFPLLNGGSVVIKAPFYKPEGRGFETRKRFFVSVYLILPAALSPGVYSNRNEYQKRKNNVSGE
jgi:hypothetical protein